jgi:hypothetical protein
MSPTPNDDRKPGFLTSLWWIVGLLPVLYVGFTSVRMLFFPPRLVIGPETTVVDGPLRPDGTIDYVAALNDAASAGVTVENNAVVPLVRAFGPEIVDDDIRKTYFDRLGIDVPPEEGDYFVTLDEFLTRQEVDPDRAREINDFLGEIVPFTVEEQPELAAWVESLDGPAERFVEATRRERWYSPLFASPGGNSLLAIRLPVEQDVRGAARLLVRRAMLRLGEGDVAAACEDALACHRLGGLVTQHPMIIPKLIGYAVDAIAAGITEQIVLSGQLTPELAERFRDAFEALPPFSPMLEAIDRGERFTCLDATLGLVRGTAGAPAAIPGTIAGSLDPNVMLRRFNEAFDEIVELLETDDVPTRQRRLEEWDEQFQERAAQARSIMPMLVSGMFNQRTAVSEGVAEVLITLLIPANRQAQTAEDRNRMRLDLVRVGWALGAYRAREGEFPEHLDQLVPRDLAELPVDLFSGDALKYARHEAGFLLYSVGPNGLDDGGLSGPHECGQIVEPCDDIRFGRLAPEVLEDRLRD